MTECVWISRLIVADFSRHVLNICEVEYIIFVKIETKLNNVNIGVLFISCNLINATVCNKINSF